MSVQKNKFLCRVQEILTERGHKMRILYFFMVFCFVITFGCAGVTPERRVLQDNILYSSASPKMGIKIHPDFKYIGKAEEEELGEDISRRREHACDKESYLFGYIEDGKITKGVVIRVQTIVAKTAFWLPDIFGRVENKLDSGNVKIQGKTYQYMVVASPGIAEKYEVVFIADKGYAIPSAFLVKVLGKITGHADEILTRITYFEDISHKYSRRDWVDKYTLSDEQQSFLKAFIDRSQESVQILTDKEIKEKVAKEIAPKEPVAQEQVAKKFAPPAASIDKVVIGVLDVGLGRRGRKEKEALMKELRRNTRVELVDIHEVNSLSDLKKFEYLLAERYQKYYGLDMILHVYRTRENDVYFSLIDLYTKKIKEVSIGFGRGVEKGRKLLDFRGVSRKILVREDLNRVLREKEKALAK